MKFSLFIIIITFILLDFPKHDKIQKSTDPWRALAISVGETGATELAGVSKIARNVICPLADKGISVLVLTTYQSDYILVSWYFLTTMHYQSAQLFQCQEKLSILVTIFKLYA